MDREQVESTIEQLASDESNENNHDYEDFKTFLINSTTGDVPLYINRRRGPFLYSFTLPEDVEMNIEHIQDINKWNFGSATVSSAAAIWCDTEFPGGVKTERLILDKNPLSQCSSETLKNATPLFFERARDFDSNRSFFLELEQTMSHALELSQRPGASGKWAHFRVGGGSDDVVSGMMSPYSLLTMDSRYLELYLHLAKARLLRVFDFSRVPNPFHGWMGLNSAQDRIGFGQAHPFYARHHVQRSGDLEASFIRGFQIFDRVGNSEAMMKFYEASW